MGGARSRRSSRGLTSVTTRTCADIIAQQTTARAPSPPHGALDGTRQDHARRHRDSHITSDPEQPVDLYLVDRLAGGMQYSHGQQPGCYEHRALQLVQQKNRSYPLFPELTGIVYALRTHVNRSTPMS